MENFNEKNLITELRLLADRCEEKCKKNGWGLDWKEGGSYLHLEASEFVEATRGKGDSTIESEAGDTLFVLLAMMKYHNLDMGKVVEHLEMMCER